MMDSACRDFFDFGARLSDNAGPFGGGGGTAAAALSTAGQGEGCESPEGGYHLCCSRNSEQGLV